MPPTEINFVLQQHYKTYIPGDCKVTSLATTTSKIGWCSKGTIRSGIGLQGGEKVEVIIVIVKTEISFYRYRKFQIPRLERIFKERIHLEKWNKIIITPTFMSTFTHAYWPKVKGTLPLTVGLLVLTSLSALYIKHKTVSPNSTTYFLRQPFTTLYDLLGLPCPFCLSFHSLNFSTFPGLSIPLTR